MKAASQISRDEIRSQLDAKRAFLLIDVLPAEFYEEAHLPGAKQACVFEVNFLEQVRALAPDKGTPIVFYGSGSQNLASATAAEKLLNAGYLHVYDYRAGIEDWLAAGYSVEGNRREQKQEEEPREGSYLVDTGQSEIQWTGRNLNGTHTGTLKLLSGTIEVESGRVTRGAFMIDMQSIRDRDIEDSEMRHLLNSHLASDDFFDVQRFPTAEFRLTRIASIAGVAAGSPNAELSGELTIKGVSREISFRGVTATTPDGRIAAEAHFDIDRTQWNVLYGSGKFYEKLGKHLVHDDVAIFLKLITR
jgi:polyisoprenoid-binding protein YceI/rhodanese-related sulfurtransferase